MFLAANFDLSNYLDMWEVKSRSDTGVCCFEGATEGGRAPTEELPLNIEEPLTASESSSVGARPSSVAPFA